MKVLGLGGEMMARYARKEKIAKATYRDSLPDLSSGMS